MSSPRVSVVVPVMNGMPYITESISSILESTFENFELIISNNSSNDGTNEYLSSITDPRVVIFHHKVKLTASENWKFATGKARGEYIKLVCADDLISKDCLQRQIFCLDNNPDVSIVASRRSVIDADGRVVIQKHGLLFLAGKVDGKRALRRSIASGTNQFGEPASVLIRSQDLMGCRPWRSDFPYATDIDTYAQLLIKGSFYGLETIDASFRLSPNSWSSQIGKQQSLEFSDWVSSFEAENNLYFGSVLKLTSKVLAKTWRLARTVIGHR